MRSRPILLAMVIGLVAAAALVATLVAVFLGIVLRPGPAIPPERAAAIALAHVQASRYNNRPVTGWAVDSVEWDSSGQVTFSGKGGPPPAPCGPVACPRRELWYVRLHAPTQPDGSMQSAEVYVDAHSGTVVAQGVRAVTGANGGPPPGARSSPVPPG